MFFKYPTLTPVVNHEEVRERLAYLRSVTEDLWPSIEEALLTLGDNSSWGTVSQSQSHPYANVDGLIGLDNVGDFYAVHLTPRGEDSTLAWYLAAPVRFYDDGLPLPKVGDRVIPLGVRTDLTTRSGWSGVARAVDGVKEAGSLWPIPSFVAGGYYVGSWIDLSPAEEEPTDTPEPPAPVAHRFLTVQEYDEAIERLSDALNEFADEQDFCPEYERAVQSLGLPGRESLAVEHCVGVSRKVTVTFTTTTTQTGHVHVTVPESAANDLEEGTHFDESDVEWNDIEIDEIDLNNFKIDNVGYVQVDDVQPS